jgi:hypothetical protein
MRHLLTLAAALPLAACYTYAPVDFRSVPQGARVGLDLTMRGAAANEARFGPDIIYLEGQAVSFGSDSLTVMVARTRSRRGMWSEWSGERVAVDHGSVAILRQRRFSKLRTALAAAAVIGAVAVTAATDLIGLGDLGGSKDPGDGRPNPG